MSGEDDTDPWDSLLDVDAVAAAWGRTTRTVALQVEVDLTDSGRRFEMEDELGRGAMGIVSNARDVDLEREVAVKRLREGRDASAESVDLFLAEARLTGSLEHPSIVPVYELGRLRGGEPFFAMRRLRGRSLADLLRALRAGDEAAARKFGRTRLLTLFLQICGAVDYAHSRGVVHRDLKPANVVVGEYGDVQLLDWGIALRLEDIDAPIPAGVVCGTPGFIAPELLWQREDVVSRLAEVWALGALFYELLTCERAVVGFAAQEILEETLTGRIAPPRLRAPDRDVPDELAELCMEALSSTPADRPASAGELARRIEEFLEGARERARLRQEADAAVAKAQEARDRLATLQEELSEAEALADGLLRRVQPWHRIEDKRPMWAAEDRVRDLRDGRDDLFHEAEAAYLEAQRRVPDHAGAREGLSTLWWARLAREELAGDRRGVRRAAARLREIDGEEAEDRLRGDGALSLTSDPPGAHVWLHPFELHDRLLMPRAGRDLGTTPLDSVPVPLGHHLLMLDQPGLAPMRLPITVQRGAKVTRFVSLRAHLDVPEGMVHVPGGTFITGGAPTPYGKSTRLEMEALDDFAIGTFPVTLGEYAAFLAVLDPAEADDRTPLTPGGVALLRREGERFVPHVDPLRPGIKPAAARIARRLPVVAVRWEDAAAYCAWRATTIGRDLCLPSALQWEKAARGVDGRRYPWGDSWDPGFVNRAGALEGAARLEPVGMYGMDQSMYGMRDSCGGVREWCAEEVGEERACRGGDWTRRDDQPLATHSSVPPEVRSVRIGFRLCLPL